MKEATMTLANAGITPESRAQTIPVAAYFSPHPMSEAGRSMADLLIRMPGFIAEDDPESGEPAVSRPENIELYDKLARKIESEFRKAFGLLAPLTDNLHIGNIAIAINALEMLNSDLNGAAVYVPSVSISQQGRYFFIANPPLIYRYLLHLRYSIPLSPSTKKVWQHETIHMLDHDNIMQSALFENSDSTSENLKGFQLKSRIEGLAEIPYLLSGHSRYTSHLEALADYQKHLQHLRTKTAGQSLSDESFRKELFNHLILYDTGPWLILEGLRHYGGGIFRELVEYCILKAEEKIPVGQEAINHVIDAGLTMRPADYLNSLSEITTVK